MNKKHFIKILLDKHKDSDKYLENKAFKLSTPRYQRKDFKEGYKFALLEVQSLVDTFQGTDITGVDDEFIKQIKYKA